MTPKPDIIVDTRGLFCPLPVIRTSETAGNVESGSVIEVIADDPAVEFDMPAWCASAGHTIKLVLKEGDVFRYFIVTGHPADGARRE
ncbi:MAG: sulfurtransferase TusA family protein [Chitinivibrionia bacterium]|nr:sulfurtransferase TusA family protein [Chitinivibrionia bacterium]